MNKAFLKEPEQGAEYCPQCKSLGQPVSQVTLDALVRPEFRQQLGATASFCPYPTCAVAYFDAFERSVLVESLVKPIYPKDAAAPICACFGLTLEDIDAVLDALCTTAEQRQLEPDWIPRLIDPDDEPLLQLAVEAQVPIIVTRNARHLNPAQKFGIEVLTPAEFLARLRKNL